MSIGQNKMFKTSLTDSSATPEEGVGEVRVEIDHSTGACKKYKYVQTAADTTVADGTALGYTDLYGVVASSDPTDFGLNRALGVGIGVIAAESYGWVQIYGEHDAILTDGGDDIVDGDNVILSATDGTVNRMIANTAPTNTVVAVATADDSASAVSGMICLG